MKTQKNIINKLICFFSCFHNHVSKNAFARSAIFSFLVTYIYIYVHVIYMY